MKKTSLIILFCISHLSAIFAQIPLNKSLIDNIINNNTLKENHPISSINVYKFINYHHKTNAFNVSKVTIYNRTDIPLNSYLYNSNGCFVLILLDDCFINSDMLKDLTRQSEPEFKQILDSLKLPDFAKNGIVWDRLYLEVLTVKKCRLSRNRFKIIFKKIFPAGLAPRELMPVINFSDGQYMVNPPYEFIYDNKGEMLEVYKKQLIPKKPVKIRLKKYN
ncbi:MAG: hypothetical protein FD170_760 [Bacteroidetes bacterium]|nr:MAG: hypothetical protein FD170_760 [Bacteroidota bacterium]